MHLIPMRADVGKLLGSHSVRRDGGGGHAVLEVLQRRVGVGTGTALSLATAKTAVVTGDKLTQPGESLLCNGLDVLAPGHQLLHGDSVGGVAVKAGLVNGHADFLDGIAEHGGIALESAQSVEPHLRVAHGGHRDTLAVLVVRDAEGVPANHHIVTGAKALRDILPKVHLHLRYHSGRAVIEHGLLNQVLNVEVTGLVHFLRVERVLFELIEAGGVGAGGHHSEFLEGLELTDGMGQAALLRIFAGALRQVLLKAGGRRAFQPAGCR